MIVNLKNKLQIYLKSQHFVIAIVVFIIKFYHKTTKTSILTLKSYKMATNRTFFFEKKLKNIYSQIFNKGKV